MTREDFISAITEITEQTDNPASEAQIKSIAKYMFVNKIDLKDLPEPFDIETAWILMDSGYKRFKETFIIDKEDATKLRDHANSITKILSKYPEMEKPEKTIESFADDFKKSLVSKPSGLLISQMAQRKTDMETALSDLIARTRKV